jgi:predicted permease
MPRLDEAALDWRVAFFAALLTAAAALAAGVIPAWVSARRQRTVPAASSRVAGGGRRVQAALVAAQIAVGTVLAGSAALLVRSYGALVRVDPGFAADGAVTFRVAATWDEDRGRVGALQQQLLEQIAALPGVHAAGLANFLPGTGATLRSQIRVEGIAGAEADGSMTVGTRTVSPGYFAALGIPLVAGRWCETSAFGAPGPREAVVNRQFAAVYGNGAPLTGRRLTFTQDATTWSIVGVAGDVTEDGAGAPIAPYVYVCMPLGSWPDPEYVVRATGDPSLLVPAIRGIVRRLDPGRPVFAISRLADVFAAGLEQPRLNAAALTGFTAAALTLVAVGLYALLMLGVTDRRRELGVRLALGASPARLARGVLGSTLRIVGAGVAAGAVLLACAARLLASLLFGVSPFDPLALGSGAVALAIVAAAAAAGPIRRVLAVDPAVALRD